MVFFDNGSQSGKMSQRRPRGAVWIRKTPLYGNNDTIPCDLRVKTLDKTSGNNNGRVQSCVCAAKFISTTSTKPGNAETHKQIHASDTFKSTMVSC